MLKSQRESSGYLCRGAGQQAAWPWEGARGAGRPLCWEWMQGSEVGETSAE